MKYWKNKYVEERDIYEGQFRSLIHTPALKGNVLNDSGEFYSTYELEVVKDPCTLRTRIIPETQEKTTDMCVMFEYRSIPIDGVDGGTITTVPVPITELTKELTSILVDNNLINPLEK